MYWGRWRTFLPAAAPVFFFALAIRAVSLGDETLAIALFSLAMVCFGLWIGLVVAGRRQTRF